MTNLHASPIEQLKENCPNVANHTDGPSGYIAWFKWVGEKGKTHKQTKCPECGFYTIWKRKKGAI